ncbi:toprim domain-containing protein [Myroides indicus]|uniref:CHC2-type zinc finger protein n=1 Tax=Myroides indicus TaxID=1323422 RepID=A0A4R7F5T9_9FLAO|nr:toprim domain-containing protein [Myroides indicus]TDS59637.1 CHC2-type zinc finger protein [Myroides indicus]
MNNIQELKKISIINILNKLNIESVEKKKEEFWFKAPWRNEQTASVKCKNNLFFDFGDSSFKGNTIDFIMKLFNYNFKDAVKWLQDESVSFSFHQPENIFPKKIDNKQSYSIIKIQTLQNTILIEYLKSRKLNIELCKKYLVEVYYQLNSKKYFGVGFKNDLGGIEIRNKYAKLCLGKKWYTSIKGKSNQLIVLESWSDFISLMMLFPKTESQFDFVVLNTLSMLNKLDTVYEEYKNVFLALDNDKAGTKATQKYLEILGAKCTDIRYLYKNGSKDLNDYLLGNY